MLPRVNFSMTFFSHVHLNFYLSSHYRGSLLHKQPFITEHYFQVITPHFMHHCTLIQTLPRIIGASIQLEWIKGCILQPPTNICYPIV